VQDRTAQLLAPPADVHDLETMVRGRVREMIVEILAEEAEGALSASKPRAHPGTHRLSPRQPAPTALDDVVRPGRGRGATRSPEARHGDAGVHERYRSALRPAHAATGCGAGDELSRLALWRGRDLAPQSYAILILDAIRVPVRLARRVVKVPAQAVIG